VWYSSPQAAPVATRDWRTIREGLARLRAYGQYWKWGSDSGLTDIALAEAGLEALERRKDGIVEQLALWGDEQDGAPAE